MRPPLKKTGQIYTFQKNFSTHLDNHLQRSSLTRFASACSAEMNARHSFVPDSVMFFSTSTVGIAVVAAFSQNDTNTPFTHDPPPASLDS